MDAVNTVALWAGLLTGVISVALAIVSISFTYLVEKRASDINARVIQTLQKIESAVERTTDDTANLIKVAWERMLPPVGAGTTDKSTQQTALGSDDTAKQIASGVAAELRAELSSIKDDQSVIDEINQALARLEETIEAQLESNPPRSRRAETDALYNTLESLSPYALALLAELVRNKHLTAKQYKDLANGPLANALAELRNSALLIPLAGFDEDLEEIPVYWLSPDIPPQLVNGLLPLVNPPAKARVDRVRHELARVGYDTGRDAN